MKEFFLSSICAMLYAYSMLTPASAAIDTSTQVETSKQGDGAPEASGIEKRKSRTDDIIPHASSPRSNPKPDSEKIKVRRNQVVDIEYTTGHLKIIISARALKNGMSGETINLLNISSRSTLYGVVNDDGRITLKGKEE